MGGDIVVGADIGSSAARAVALRGDGTIAASSTAAYPGSSSWPAGRADPEGWLAGLAEVFAALGRAAPAAARPLALAVGGQSPTTVPAGGGGPLAVTCRHPVGTPGTPEDQHAAQAALLRDELGSGTQPAQLWDWVLNRLGAPRLAGRWPGDPDLPDFGERIPCGTVAGEADGTAGIPAGTLLVAGAQDAYLSFWAGGLDRPRRAVDPGGRTGGLGVAVAAGNRPSGMYALRGPARDVDIVGGPTSSHGLVLEWWSAITGRAVPELLDLAAGADPGTNGVLVLPYLEGERAPRWDRDLTAEVRGLRSDTGPADLARALLESTAFGLGHIAAELAAQGVTFDVLVCGGSPGRSRLWASIKASVLGVPVEVPVDPELTAYGAALAAGAAVGWWPAPGDGASGSWPRPEFTVVEPEHHDEYVTGFRRFVAAGDEAMRRLEEQREQEQGVRT